MTRTNENIIFLSSWSFHEPLTHSYLLPNVRIVRNLIAHDKKVFVQTLEKNLNSMSRERKEEITNLLAKENLIWYPLPYRKFGALALLLHLISFIRLFRFVVSNKIQTLHAFAPAAGTAALFLHFFLRKKLIIDSWEPHAEAMAETGTWRKNSLVFRLLFWSEKKQTQFADILLAASPAMKKYAEEKFGLPHGKILHRPACVDTLTFKPDAENRQLVRTKMNWTNKIVCVCVSKLGGLYLEKELFELFLAGKKAFGEKFHALLISSTSAETVSRLAQQTEYPQADLTHFSTAHENIPQWLSACDFAVNPQKPVPSKRYGTPVKDGEYWACGLPIMILPDISDDSNIIIEDNAGIILKSTNMNDLEVAMHQMKNLLETEKNIAGRMHNIAMKYRGYHIAEYAYREAYG